MGEFTEPLEALGGRESPPDDALDRILRRVDRRRARRRVDGLVVGLAAAVAVVAGGAFLVTNGGPPPTPGSTSPSAGIETGVYHDPAGWSLTVPRGWTVVPFRSSKDGVVAAGAQISNVPLPAPPAAVSWAPIQADGRSFPSDGIALVVGTQEGAKVRRNPPSDLPITYPDDWARGSSAAGPTLDTIWFRGGGRVFVATVKTGDDAAVADRRALERMVHSIRFEGGPTPSPATSAAPLWAEIVLPTTTIASGSSISGTVVVHNDTGRAIHASGCGSLFAVALGNDRITPDVAWPTCLQPFTIPVGASSWPVTVAATYLECGAHPPLLSCTDGHPPGLPPGDYRAMFFQSSKIVPAPPSIDVRVAP